MVERSQRSFLRDGTGPRAVDAGSGRDKHRHNDRRPHKESDEREKHRSRKADTLRSPRREYSHRRKHSGAGRAMEKPTTVLDVIGQPTTCIQLGMPIEKSAMLSLKLPSIDSAVPASQIDTTGLFAVASLVRDTRNGERVPVDTELLSGENMLDSVRPLPDNVLDSLRRNQPQRLSLGYFTFRGLIIRQVGTFRIRTTLIKMGESGATSLAAVDSEPIEVERRTSNAYRRHQCVYG